MKKNFTKSLLVGLLLAFGTANVFAQGEQEIFVLDPSEMQPAKDGYYLAGTMKDEDGDGTPEFYKGCYDAYGDSHHFEEGTQQGFTYGGAMIMPTCQGKGTPPEGWPEEGYIQLGKHKTDPETGEVLEFGWIMTPAFTNLQSLEILVGTDLSIGSHREIYMMIESSLDGGKTWEDGWFIKYQITNQGGDVVSFEADGESVAFNGMVEDSQENPMVLRITTIPASPDKNGERLKIFGVELVATPAGGGGGDPTAIGDDIDENPFFQVQNNAFVAEQGKIMVHTITGTLVGSGKSVNIPAAGFYVVRSDNGKAHKIIIQ